MRRRCGVQVVWQAPTGPVVQHLTFSPREQEVLWGLSQGAGTRVIADRLCLSVKTIETYYGALRRKVGVQTVGQLTVFAVYWCWFGPHPHLLTRQEQVWEADISGSG